MCTHQNGEIMRECCDDLFKHGVLTPHPRFSWFFFCSLRSVPSSLSCSDTAVSDVQCQHLALDLQRCYNDNPSRSLDCSTLVKAFVTCSNAAHADYLNHVNANSAPLPSN